MLFLLHSIDGEQKRTWKRYLLDALLAAIAAVVLTVPIRLFRLQINVTTALFAYVLIVALFAYRHGFRTALLTTLLVCVVFDFFFVPPVYSLLIRDVQDAIDLLAFVLCAITVSFLLTRMHHFAERVRRQKEEERIQYSVEASRREQQVNAYWTVMQETREERDLQKQLALVARTIEQIFACCGVSKCTFLGPDIDGRLFLHRMSDESKQLDELSTQEEDSAAWVMKHGQSVVIRETPLIAREKGGFSRRVVASTITNHQHGYQCSYLVPLLSGQKAPGMSGQKVIGVLYLLIEDTDHPEVLAIKRRLEAGCPVSPDSDSLFSQLVDHATNLIEQALIERALMERESQNGELQRRSEELRATIISTVSHDFHTPLTLIKGVATGLLVQDLQAGDAAEHRQMLESVVSEVDWLERMVMKMLDLSHIEKGVLKPEKELYPIDEIILTTLDRGHMRSLLAGRRVDSDVPDELSPVEVDPLFIEHVLVNLIENAVRYAPEDSPIEIRVHEVDRRLIVAVADHGPGIPAQELERIFESFYRVRPRRGNELATLSGQGSGLGLAVCRGFVEAHGGSIWAENRQEGGAVFQFTLPL
jgi:two-component system, OmpR family, sensor histidine kinase KdpD